MTNRILILCLILFTSFAYAKRHAPSSAITTPLSITDLKNYADYSVTLKKLIASATELSKKNLTYMYGSANPKNKGMDCSGTIYYLLNQAGLENVPRSADDMFNWVEKKGKLHKVKAQYFDSPDFSALKPGDLLFWSGTYATSHAISHVMIYIGKDKNDKPLMFGASDGRTYQGKRMWGVSVFDFELPNGRGSAKFVGFSCVPGLTCED